MTEEQFRELVMDHLNERQKQKFLQGRQKYNNNPFEIDYEKEMQEEIDDLVIYKTMQMVTGISKSKTYLKRS